MNRILAFVVVLAVVLALLWAGAAALKTPRDAALQLRIALEAEERLGQKIMIAEATGDQDALEKVERYESTIVRRYEKVIERYPDTPEADEATFRLARRDLDKADAPRERLALYDDFLTSSSASRHGASAEAYERYIRDHPGHERVDDAQLRLAEIYDEKLKKSKEACEAFEKLTQGAFLRLESRWLPLTAFGAAMTADLRLTVPADFMAFGPGGSDVELRGGVALLETEGRQEP
jgi:hypothetical protein